MIGVEDIEDEGALRPLGELVDPEWLSAVPLPVRNPSLYLLHP